ncbi:MAG: glycosyltransferase family 39 protein [Desulfovibrio sp.]|jgi:hypothetical protein|nr:glycosyltransferase family 39 protein [Desulfovibrio sp.]
MGPGFSFLFGRSAPRVAAFFLFALGAFLLLQNLGKGSLYPWDESLSAMRTQYMFEDGISMTASTYGSPDFNKPPLYYWLAAGSFHLFGPGLFALRLPGVLFAIGCFVCVYFLTKKVARSAWAACFALACLVLNPHWLNFARLGMLETAMSFSLVAAILYGCFGKGRLSPAGGVATALLLSIGAWVKHPFYGALLPFFYCYWRCCDHAAKPLKPFLWSIGTFLLVGTGWYVLNLVVRGGQFWNFYFEYNVFKRVVYGIEGHSGWFFSPVREAFIYAPAAFLCFTASLLALFAAWRKKDGTAALAVWLAWLFLILLCCITGKRKMYVVAWFPLGAVCAGFGAAWMARFFRRLLNEGSQSMPASRICRLFQDRKRLLWGTGLVCVYALIHTGVVYKVTPDHSPVESGVYRAVKQHMDAHAFVMTNVIPPAVLFFELGRTANTAAATDGAGTAFLDAAFARAASGEPVYLVMEENENEPNKNRERFADAAGRVTKVHVDAVSEQGLYWAVRLTPVGNP